MAGNYAYITDGYYGLGIINVATPENPQEVGFYDSPGYAKKVTVVDNYAYLADSKDGLHIIYVADPAHPIRVGFYNTPGRAVDVTVDKDYIYVANSEGGLLILQFISPVSTFTIPPSGGSFTSSVDGTSYIFPTGVFTDTAIVTHIPLFPEDAPSPGDLVGINHFFEVTAVYSSTGQPAQLIPGKTYTLTVQYNDAKLGPAIEETLALYYWDGNQWIRESSSDVNIEDNIVSAQAGHLGAWAVLGETQRVYIPLVFNRD